jgi:hypothetical protein
MSGQPDFVFCMGQMANCCADFVQRRCPENYRRQLCPDGQVVALNGGETLRNGEAKYLVATQDGKWFCVTGRALFLDEEVDRLMGMPVHDFVRERYA